MDAIDKQDKRPSRGAILLSGFVCPGVGQFMQRRWLAGALFGGGFVVLFGMLLAQCFRVIMAFYRLAFDGNLSADQPSVARILVIFGLCLLVYLLNVGDAYLAHRRAARRSAVRRHLDPLLASILNAEEGEEA
ncbi:MAG: hypothetical protein QGH42_06990 [Kiritimatiellia bacterium]|jgi:hypothetical protein|nr:hypothetical protein [Kiritimatiellia bacterium]MDP6630783.1 hypothetical protein [Kiritimatiellia bacterium]MDP6809353.1 hypothetical protein [Kiritimatiellia bacterium]MDP7023969.1 hypothetical protein [Kiritimatiellia bacterium]